MRIDLLEQWLKMFPYGYCDGMNFQTCRANENNCPYCMSNVHCSDGNAAIEYYQETAGKTPDFNPGMKGGYL